MQANNPEQQSPGAQASENVEGKEPLVLAEEPGEEEGRKAEEYLEMLRRTLADFVNYKRRVAQEQVQERTAAQSAIIEQFLPVLDDLGRAIGGVPADLLQHPWVQGILLVSRRLGTTFEQLGIRQIGKTGEPFDPRWNEAIVTEVRQDVPAGTIVNVIRPGYILGERVIRPAQVVVANAG